ncbi:Hemolysin C [Corynebacterium occultum]|uniref:Hemolysin C n=1 Tax=Corynebacterium occultum TaxID=2675219 RepID=A0A6B8W6M1_9CORY|nr:hemolysin family protein [Corynebacterium occultum]QGU06965.1 Hemolysin C [Corynebacterium occultum]
MSIALNAVLVLIFVLIGGVFAATEMALVSLRESQVRKLEGGGQTARKVASLARDSGYFLSAVQIGVTFAGFFSSAFGASTIAPQLNPILTGWGVPESLAGILALVGMTLVISYLSLVLGEVVPKRIAMQKAERFSLLVAPPLGAFARTMTPVVWVVNSSSNLLLRLLGFDPAARNEQMSTEEVRDIVTSHEGFAESERGLLTDVFKATDRLAAEVMRHRSDMVAFPASVSVREVTAAVVEGSYSRYPVFEDGIDEIIGFIHVRDLLVEAARGHGEKEVRELVREIAFLPGTVHLPQALTQMRAHGHHIAIVMDEYGGTDGMLTLEDLLEELVGEIWDEFDRDEKQALLKLHESRQLDGSTNLEDFADATGVFLPEGPYETVAGWILSRLGRVAATGDTFPVPAAWTRDPEDDDSSGIRYRLEVTQVQGNRIQTVKLHKEEVEGKQVEE